MINTADCTGSWGRFGFTLQTLSFPLTKVNMVSQQPACWHNKKMCYFLGNWRAYSSNGKSGCLDFSYEMYTCGLPPQQQLFLFGSMDRFAEGIHFYSLLLQKGWAGLQPALEQTEFIASPNQSTYCISPGHRNGSRKLFVTHWMSANTGCTKASLFPAVFKLKRMSP